MAVEQVGLYNEFKDLSDLALLEDPHREATRSAACQAAIEQSSGVQKLWALDTFASLRKDVLSVQAHAASMAALAKADWLELYCLFVEVSVVF